MHLVLTFFLVTLTSQAFASDPSDLENLLPTAYHFSQQSGKTIPDVDLLKRSSTNDSSMYAASNNGISAIQLTSTLISPFTVFPSH